MGCPSITRTSTGEATDELPYEEEEQERGSVAWWAMCRKKWADRWASVGKMVMGRKEEKASCFLNYQEKNREGREKARKKEKMRKKFYQDIFRKLDFRFEKVFSNMPNNLIDGFCFN